MTYPEALAYLESLVNYEHQRDPEAMRAMYLERMRRLCRRLGDPQRRFRSILVAGTNGKGSICAMLYAMLRESSLRVGCYTSPHLEQARERIRIWTEGPREEGPAPGEDWISEAEFVAMIERLQPALESMRQDGPAEAPTYFEALTAVALAYFDRRQVEIAVLEVGLGGRLDATNIVDQAVSIIAPIGLDHAEILGADLAAIAREKAGIIKPGQLAFTAPQDDAVTSVLRDACDAQGVPLLVCGQDVTVRIDRHDLEGLRVSITGLRGIYPSLEIPLIGRHQATNAALAVGALEALSPTGVPYSLVERGLSRVDWPGRLEVVSDAPLVILDGAHNPEAARALREALAELCEGRRIHFLVGVSSDKDVEAFGQVLGSLAVGATCTQSGHPRALDATELARRLMPFCPDVNVICDAADAYTYLRNALSPEDVLVVTGSLFLVGQVRAGLRRSIRSRRREAAVA